MRTGFFSNAVEGGRLLARIEFKNNGYLNQDDFCKFFHQLTNNNSFNEQQFAVLRDFMHTLGGSRLAKQQVRAQKFEKASDRLVALAAPLRVRKKVVHRASASSSSASISHAPENHDTFVSAAKGGGLMYIAKPRNSNKLKLPHFLSTNSHVACDDSPWQRTTACEQKLTLDDVHKQRSSMDLEDDCDTAYV